MELKYHEDKTINICAICRNNGDLQLNGNTDIVQSWKT